MSNIVPFQFYGSRFQSYDLGDRGIHNIDELALDLIDGLDGADRVHESLFVSMYIGHRPAESRSGVRWGIFMGTLSIRTERVYDVVDEDDSPVVLGGIKRVKNRTVLTVLPQANLGVNPEFLARIGSDYSVH